MGKMLVKALIMSIPMSVVDVEKPSYALSTAAEHHATINPDYSIQVVMDMSVVELVNGALSWLSETLETRPFITPIVFRPGTTANSPPDTTAIYLSVAGFGCNDFRGRGLVTGGIYPNLRFPRVKRPKLKVSVTCPSRGIG